MGMGTSACSATCTEWQHVQKLCEQETKALEQLLEKYEVNGLAGVACLLDESSGGHEDYEALELDVEAFKEIYLAWEDVQHAFSKATTVRVHAEEMSLTLDIGHYDSDNGDRYDDEEIRGRGYYLHVEGCWKLTPAGEKFKDIIEKKFWTVFG